MLPTEVFYDVSSVAIALILFFAIVAFNELGFRAGRYVQAKTDDEVKAMTGSIQGSILGLLALLLGFTFSMSMQRYDARSMAVIDEANTIGTAMLRVKLLPDAYRDEADAALKQYVALRAEVGSVDLTREEERARYNERAVELQNQLWNIVTQATDADPRPVTTGAFLNSLNDMIDAQGKRNAILQQHVPETILLLLFFVFVVNGAMMGYSSGLSGKRMTVPIVLVSLLITLIVFTIIDLDRPKRGLIQVDQSVMQSLESAT